MSPDERLAELGLEVPSLPMPVANYVPFVRSGSLVTISGQICFGPDGKIAPAHLGRVGDDGTPEAALYTDFLVHRDWTA